MNGPANKIVPIVGRLAVVELSKTAGKNFHR